jgi:hypothetical protein
MRAHVPILLCRSAALAVLALTFCIVGCDTPMDLSTLPQENTKALDTAYIAIDPPFGGFTQPEGILIGKDQLLYVADTRANRIVMMNRAGGLLSARTMIHPAAISQDTRLDLLVGAEMIAANGDTVGAIFRVHLVSASQVSAHRLDVARVDTVWRELARPQRRFNGIAVLSDNSYLAVRDGPDNSSFIDPDARILQFDDDDAFITPLSAFVTGVGTGIANINHPTGIAAFPRKMDFVLTQSSEGVAYGALWMVYSSTSDFQGWLPRFDPANTDERSADFVRPNRYIHPSAVAIDPSRTDIFVADGSLDSIFKYNSRGVVRPESFGFSRSNGMMVHPSGLAFFEKILYVLDKDQGIILRFRLSTDWPR